MRIVCLDFETANYFRGSICSAGIAIIEGNKIAKSKHWLIKPHNSCNNFMQDFTKLHGISKDTVKSAKEFAAIYVELQPYLDNNIIFAHSAEFDITALKEVLTLYAIPFPNFNYACTVNIAKALWPQLPHHTLEEVCKQTGHNLNHHNAEDDARACAAIVIKALGKTGTDITQTLSHLKVPINKVYPGLPHNQGKIVNTNKYKKSKFSIKDIQPASAEFDQSHPAFNKRFVFTGELSNTSRQDAMQKVVNAGGKISNTINKDTDYLVEGVQDLRLIKDGKESTKTKEARTLISRGNKIKVIREADFIKLFAGTIPASTISKPAPLAFNEVMDRIKKREGNEITTKTGVKISYKVSQDKLIITKNKWEVSIADLEKAYKLWPVRSTKDFESAGLKSSGTYIWAVLNAIIG